MFALSMDQVASLNSMADSLGLSGPVVLVLVDVESGVPYQVVREGRGWVVNEASTVRYSNGDLEAVVKFY